MKKIITLLLILALCFSVSACGKQENSLKNDLNISLNDALKKDDTAKSIVAQLNDAFSLTVSSLEKAKEGDKRELVSIGYLSEMEFTIENIKAGEVQITVKVPDINELVASAAAVDASNMTVGEAISYFQDYCLKVFEDDSYPVLSKDFILTMDSNNQLIFSEEFIGFISGLDLE